MNDDKQTGEIVKVYVTNKPRILGIFHYGPVGEGTPGAARHAGVVGIIGHIGPCRCGDPTHTFPRWYSLTPCIYVRLGNRIATIRIPSWLAMTFLWLG